MSSSDDIWAGASWATTGGSVAECNPATGSTSENRYADARSAP